MTMYNNMNFFMQQFLDGIKSNAKIELLSCTFEY